MKRNLPSMSALTDQEMGIDDDSDVPAAAAAASGDAKSKQMKQKVGTKKQRWVRCLLDCLLHLQSSTVVLLKVVADRHDRLGIVELCATILKIMRALVANYAHLFQFKFQSIKNGNRNTLSTRKQ